MKTIAQIYEEYKIMPNLQLHQLRVAAVAKVIGESLETKIDLKSVIAACLLHDMGNILKFDLTKFPEFTHEHGLSHWEKVKSDFKSHYGDEEHIATYTIARELQASQATMACLKAVGFSQAVKQCQSKCLEHKLCCYADQRVGPDGILSLKERIEEAHRRKASTLAVFDETVTALKKIEEQIFAVSTINPQDVKALVTNELVLELKNYPINDTDHTG